MQACTRGHISDIDWHVYVHERGSMCRRQLWLDERGTSGDLADITVRCECGLSKTMASESMSANNRQVELHRRYLYAMLLCDRDDSLELRQLWRRGPD